MRNFGRAIVLLGGALVIAWACGGKSPTQPTPPPACSFSLSSSSLSFGASGGSASVTVSTGAQCTWTAASDRSWLSIGSGASGTGPGTVAVAAAVNPTPDVRSGTLTVAGQAVPVSQEGVSTACSVTIAPTSASISKDAASGTFAVTSPASCGWTAVSSASWMTVTAGANGNGGGTVGYSVTRNTAIEGRTASIRVNEATFSLSQAGDAGLCEFHVAPVTINVCMSAAYDLVTTMTTQPACGWTVATEMPWITVSGAGARQGPGEIRFRIADNYDAPRLGVLQVRWDTPTRGQNVQVQQAGCRYAVSTSSVAFVAAGGTRSVDVYQQSDPLECGGPLQDGCLWSASTAAPWITITSPQPQRGDGRVTFVAAPNPGAPRSATIAVRDQTIVVSQAGI